jgi:hypothetical protein
MPYFSGQGRAYVAATSAGTPQAFAYLGNCSAVSFSLETDILEHKESTSGQRLTDLRLTREKKASFKATFEEFSAANLARVLWGSSTAVTGSTVSAEAKPTGLVANDYIRTVFPDISSVSIVDSAGTPATLVANTDYVITSAKHGTIQILNVAGFTQPFKVSYTYAAHIRIPMLTGAQPEVWLKFDGLNTADSNNAVLVELYRVVLDPAAQFDLIHDEVAAFEMSGSVLYDVTKLNDATLGQFGRVILVD